MNNMEQQVIEKKASRYTWEPDSEFKLTGKEFLIVYNNISGFMNGLMTPKAFLRVADAFAVLQNKLDEAIETGVAKEFIEDKQ